METLVTRPLRRFFLVLFLLVGFIGFPTSATALQHWVSLAFDPSSGAVGKGAASTQNAAQDNAIRNIPSRYYDEPGLCDDCIALATTRVTYLTTKIGYSMQCGGSARSAAAKAQSRCEAYGRACEIRKIVCIQ